MKILFVILGAVLLLLAGCAQGEQKKDEKSANTQPQAPPATPPAAEPASVGEGDQKLGESDLPPSLPEDEEDEKELNKMVDDLS